MKLSSSLKYIVGGAVVGYTKGQKLTITSYDMIDGDQCFPDKLYAPRQNLQPVPVCPNINNSFATDPNQYQLLSSGLGVLTNDVIATMKATGIEPTQRDEYVCWDFRDFSVTMGQAREFPIVLRFAEDVTINSLRISVDDANSSVRAPGKVRIGFSSQDIAFPSNTGMPGAYTGMIPLTTPVSVSAGEDFVVTIIGTAVENDCTGIGFEAPFICPLVCLSEIEVFGTISSGDSSRSRSKASKSKASKGSKAKVRKLNYV